MKYYKVFISIMVVVLLSGCAGKKNTTTEVTHQDSDKAVSCVTIPSEYNETIEDYKKLVAYRLSATFEYEHNNGKRLALNENLQADLVAGSEATDENTASLQTKWVYMLVEMPRHRDDLTMGDFSYMLKDLNGDGSQELIWLSSDYQIIYAIFTIQDGKAKLVDAYWSRYKAVILDTGEIVARGSGGADIISYDVFGNDNNYGKGLQLVRTFGNDRGAFYEIVNGERTDITEEQYNELLLMYPYEFGETWKENPIEALISTGDG